MGIKLEEYGIAAVIAPDRDFIGSDVLAARRALEEWLELGPITSFVFDLAKAAFIDSQGLEAITFAAAASHARGGRVFLAAPGDNCRKILEITRLDRRFEIFPSTEAALVAIRDGENR